MLVFETTPPTRIVSFVTPGWSTAAPPPPPPPPPLVVVESLDLSSEALLQAAKTNASTARTAISRTRIELPPGSARRADLTLTSGNAPHQASPPALSANRKAQ